MRREDLSTARAAVSRISALNGSRGGLATVPAQGDDPKWYNPHRTNSLEAEKVSAGKVVRTLFESLQKGSWQLFRLGGL